MSKAKIFLVGEDEGRLTPMVETPYDNEDILQLLITRYPDLLPGEQINPEDPRRWLLVAREMGVPGDTDETGRWSLDHLFLDQDGIPTFVECKRSADTRGRREVVAQMLDYAANGIEYWSMDRLRQAATETAERENNSLDEQIIELLGGESNEDIEAYWDLVEANLRSGKVRLIFVADETPKELRRLVEFLNEKMNDVEVLAVEVKQYLGGERKAIVPRVIGLTEAARKTKSGEPRPTITREEFLGNCTSEAGKFFNTVQSQVLENGHALNMGTVGFSARVHLPKEDRLASFIYGWPPNKFDFYFAQLPIPDHEKAKLREELMSYGVFAKAGEKTLRAIVEADNIQQVMAVSDFIFQEMDDIRKNY